MSVFKRGLFRIVAILIVSFLVTVGLISCNDDTQPKPKKAIIMVTPLVGGGLYNSETGENLWDPFSVELNLNDAAELMSTIFSNLADFTSILAPLLQNTPEQSVFGALAMDQYGNSINPNIKPSNDLDPAEHHIYYGALGMFKNLIVEINSIYGNDYEVKMFNYDWRLDNAHNSQLLEEYINSNSYEEVILLSHSMGGLVVSGYLSRNDVNYKKVRAYLPLSAPFLGSFDSLKYLSDIEAFASNLLSSIPLYTYSDKVLTSPLKIKMPIDKTLDFLQTFIRNCPSIIQLLPSYDMLLTEQYDIEDDEVAFTVLGKDVHSSEELYDFYSTQEWSYLRDDEGNILKGDNNENLLKPAIANLKKFHDSMFVTNANGERVHATTLVNTYYIIGQGYTTSTIFFQKSDGTYTFKTSELGDGTVPLYSQIAGINTGLLSEQGRLYILKGTHGNTGTWEHIRERVLPLLQKVIYG
ncbi:MAG: hypothetical protein LBF12_07795 [Christensenellaceae bacterium]|jgi:pimeloyl-ACP methyl ester carboxylesterase|nr:hypothetical protein [Christensenellaceae bacterium]